ncbi:MAG: hypothetical protein HZA54_04320 [Planctomycetes bacterium]|nr:hypothetical protein [Planctomycetota bacterium]
MNSLRGAALFAALAAFAGLALADTPGAAPGADPNPAGTGSIRGRLTIAGTTEHRRYKVAEAVISLSGEGLGSAPAAPDAPSATLDQKDITFIPHVLPIVAGTAVEFKNTDACMHNIHAESDSNPPFNLGLIPGKHSQRVFAAAEVVEILCNVHAEMRAWIVILPNRYFVQPAANGEFRLAGVPPGTWQIRAWHENFPPTTQEISVRAGEESAWSVDFDKSRHINR